MSTALVERAGMDVGGWLRGLGLGEYEGRFRDNRIDAEVLPELTADDLKDIGVAVVGDRRKLMAAIARQSCINELIAEVLGGNCGMLNVFQKRGLQMSTKRESPVTHVTLKFVCA